MNRRNFLRLGALFVPAAVVEPRRVYSFIWARPVDYLSRWAELYGVPERALFESDDSVRARIMSSIEETNRRLRREIEQEWQFRLVGSLDRIVISGTIEV